MANRKVRETAVTIHSNWRLLIQDISTGDGINKVISSNTIGHLQCMIDSPLIQFPIINTCVDTFGWYKY